MARKANGSELAPIQIEGKLPAGPPPPTAEQLAADEEFGRAMRERWAASLAPATAHYLTVVLEDLRREDYSLPEEGARALDEIAALVAEIQSERGRS